MNRFFDIYSNLVNYKEKKLEISKSGFYKQNNLTIEKGHILPKEDIERNLLDSEYSQSLKAYYNEIKSRKKIHRYFHHLNSSQALTLNLFVPIIEENLYKKISNCEKPVISKRFEYLEKDSFETSYKTNFDFFFQSEIEKYFFEVKYTEQRFGPAKSDITHIHKFQKEYKSIIYKICSESVNETDFLKDYQLWRNICYSIYGYVYFVIPKFRTDLENQIEDIIRIIRPNYKEKIRILIIDDFVTEMINTNNMKLSNHYKEFRRKYLL